MIRYQEGVFKMLGFSVYLGQNLDRDYILNMADLGYDVVLLHYRYLRKTRKSNGLFGRLMPTIISLSNHLYYRCNPFIT